MRRICAWCKKELGSSNDDLGFEHTPITHGICIDCAQKTFSYRGKTLENLLDQFSDPVFLLSSEGKIITANKAGSSALGKKAESTHGQLTGDAFDCKNADLPGGCGKTIRCKTCTIRNTIANTLETGKSNIKVPAYHELQNSTGEKQIRFLITTEKVGDAVLLRIDEINKEESEQP